MMPGLSSRHCGRYDPGLEKSPLWTILPTINSHYYLGQFLVVRWFAAHYGAERWCAVVHLAEAREDA